MKQALKEGGNEKEKGNTTNNNLIVTSREDILNMIEQEKGGDIEKGQSNEEQN